MLSCYYLNLAKGTYGHGIMSCIGYYSNIDDRVNVAQLALSLLTHRPAVSRQPAAGHLNRQQTQNFIFVHSFVRLIRSLRQESIL